MSDFIAQVTCLHDVYDELDDFSTPIMYVSHVLEEIERLAHQLVLLENGRVVAAGRFDELKTSQALMQLMGKTIS